MSHPCRRKTQLYLIFATIHHIVIPMHAFEAPCGQTPETTLGHHWTWSSSQMLQYLHSRNNSVSHAPQARRIGECCHRVGNRYYTSICRFVWFVSIDSSHVSIQLHEYPELFLDPPGLVDTFHSHPKVAARLASFKPDCSGPSAGGPSEMTINCGQMKRRYFHHAQANDCQFPANVCMLRHPVASRV